MTEPAFTLGIEEEYFLVDRQTRDIAVAPPPELMAECKAALADQVSPEFLKAQIEVGTKVRSTLADARADLAQLRRTVAEVAGRFGLAPIASATHPFTDWGRSQHTDAERYTLLARDLQMVGRRLVICGMHVHVGIEDEELRIDLMNQITYFLPHLLALSTSSPFWRGDDTGLKSFRLSVFNGLPRTGLPEVFESWGEYQRQVRGLVNTGVIDDATRLWWDLRPSARFPTLELRITDICTRLDDTIAIATLYRCLLRMLWRLRRSNQRWRLYARMLISENRWRAQRYGLEEGLADFGKGTIVPFSDLLEEMIELCAEDAAHFGCTAELLSARTILARGTSADRQRSVFQAALAGGAAKDEALKAVVDHLIAETVMGV
jgi:carboxylate-amine ligase